MCYKLGRLAHMIICICSRTQGNNGLDFPEYITKSNLIAPAILHVYDKLTRYPIYTEICLIKCTVQPSPQLVVMGCW